VRKSVAPAKWGPGGPLWEIVSDPDLEEKGGALWFNGGITAAWGENPGPDQVGEGRRDQYVTCERD